MPCPTLERGRVASGSGRKPGLRTLAESQRSKCIEKMGGRVGSWAARGTAGPEAWHFTSGAVPLWNGPSPQSPPSRAERVVMPTKPQPGLQTRAFTLAREAIDEQARTVRLSFSSETAVERWWGNEILDHAPASVDLSRLNDGGALLVDHDKTDLVGVVERAWIDAKERRGRAIVRFSKSARGEEIFQDVVSGIRRQVSVSYSVGELVQEGQQDGKETYRVRRWTPLELSLVAIAADASVGVGRAHTPTPTAQQQPMKPRVLFNPNPADGGSVNLSQRAADMLSIGTRHGVPATEISQWIASECPIEDFQKHILETRYRAKPVNLDPRVGMSDSEISRYSVTRALNLLAAGKPLDGLELEASNATAAKLRRQPTGFFIPAEVASTRPMQRALSAGVASAGGFSVGVDVLAASMIDMLRNKIVTATLGATVLGGLMGDVAIPRHTGAATAYWLDETSQVNLSQQTFGQLALIPHRLSAVTAYTKQLLAQSSVDVEGFVRQDLMRILAIERDRAALFGTGGAGEPVGLLNTTGIGSVTFGAAATWAKVLDFETQVAAANADQSGPLGWAASPATRAKWKAALKTASVAGYLWEDGQVNGYRAEVFNGLTSSGKVIFGNWSDMILADWGGLDVTVDPYTLATSHQVQVVITMLVDNGIRHVASFVASTDSGAQ